MTWDSSARLRKSQLFTRTVSQLFTRTVERKRHPLSWLQERRSLEDSNCLHEQYSIEFPPQPKEGPAAATVSPLTVRVQQSSKAGLSSGSVDGRTTDGVG
jgi:hypothetical protein